MIILIVIINGLLLVIFITCVIRVPWHTFHHQAQLASKQHKFDALFAIRIPTRKNTPWRITLNKSYDKQYAMKIIRGPVQYKDVVLPDTHFKDKTLLWPSYL